MVVSRIANGESGLASQLRVVLQMMGKRIFPIGHGGASLSSFDGSVCGQDGGAVIPRSIAGYDLNPICSWHDVQYDTPLYSKDAADLELYRGIEARVDTTDPVAYFGLQRVTGRLIARVYYEAVHWFGGDAYANGQCYLPSQ